MTPVVLVDNKTKNVRMVIGAEGERNEHWIKTNGD